ncbi:MAG TPA: ABC-2 transporter permease [Peptococcaceae bacterium]|nr:ABC-2 transporter permease [Peptococcaceae bacterium]
MGKLIWKDIQVQKREKTLFIVIFLSLCVGYVMFTNPGIASIQLIVGVYLMITYANAYDYKYNAEIVINSLPVDRKQIVTAKYLSSLVYCLLMLTVALPVGILLSFTGLPGSTGFNLGVVGRFIMLSVFILVLYISFYFPVYYKLGYLNSRWANFIAFFFIFGSIGFIGASGRDLPSYGEPMTRETALQYFQGILAGNESMSFYFSLMGISILLLLLSRQLSIAIYRRKEF